MLERQVENVPWSNLIGSLVCAHGLLFIREYRWIRKALLSGHKGVSTWIEDLHP